jgi:hypothetical protein
VQLSPLTRMSADLSLHTGIAQRRSSRAWSRVKRSHDIEARGRESCSNSASSAACVCGCQLFTQPPAAMRGARVGTADNLRAGNRLLRYPPRALPTAFAGPGVLGRRAS